MMTRSKTRALKKCSQEVEPTPQETKVSDPVEKKCATVKSKKETKEETKARATVKSEESSEKKSKEKARARAKVKPDESSEESKDKTGAGATADSRESSEEDTKEETGAVAVVESEEETGAVAILGTTEARVCRCRDFVEKKTGPKKKERQNTQNSEDAAIFKLNEDCMQHILSFLSIKDRIKIQSVCKNWQRLVDLPWYDIKALQVSFTTKSQGIKYTVPILRRVLKHCGTSLRKLKLENSSEKGNLKLKLGNSSEKGFNKAVMKNIIKACPNITVLDLTGMYLTEKCAELIADNFHNLTYLGIGKCFSNHPEIISRLFLSKKSLKAFNFGNYITCEEWLLNLPEDSIESLTFDSELDIPWEYMTKVLPNLKKLRSLSVFCYLIMIEDLDKFLSTLPKANLEELCIRGSRHFRSECTPLKNVSGFINLKTLGLHSAVFNDEVLSIIGKNCKLLTSISLSDCPQVTNRGIKSLIENLDLQELHMDTLDFISEKCFASIDIASLEIVSCRYCSKILVIEAIRLLMLGSKKLKNIKLISRGELNLPDIVEEATAYSKNLTTILKMYLEGMDVTQETFYITKNLILEVQAGQT